MDVLQTKHSSRPDSSPIHMLFLNGLFCSIGTQVEMKISAGGGGALAREVQISELRFKRGDSLGFPFFFLVLQLLLLPAYPFSQRDKQMGVGCGILELFQAQK